MFESERLSRLHRDYLASFLRSQLSTLQNVLSSVENSDRYDEEYVLESTRRIERDMKSFRKACSN